MSAVFGTSQQDGCCFVSAPRTVNILWQTQLQVARWLALGSWASLQRPINRDINMESWGMGGGEATGVCPTFRDKNTKEEIQEPGWRWRQRVGRNEALPGPNSSSNMGPV